MSSYLDASVLLATFMDENASAGVDSYILAAEDGLLVSDFAAAEVASGISRLVRTKALSRTDADLRLSEFEIWREATTTSMEVHASDVRVAYAMIRRFDLGLRAPDALHLAIVRRLDATLVTLDQRMARAAHGLGIAVVVPPAS